MSTLTDVGPPGAQTHLTHHPNPHPQVDTSTQRKLTQKIISCTPHVFANNSRRWAQQGQLTESLGWCIVSLKEDSSDFLSSQSFSPEFLSFSSSNLLVHLASLGD